MSTELGDTKLYFGPTNEAELYRDTTSEQLYSTAGMHIFRSDSTSAQFWMTNTTGTAKIEAITDGLYLAAPGQGHRLWLRGTAVYCGGSFVPDASANNRDIGTSSLLWNTFNSKGNLNIQGNIIHTNGSLTVQSQGNIIHRIDSDNNGNNDSFQIANGTSNVIFRAYETGTFEFRRNDAGTAGDVNVFLYGSTSTFKFNTFSSNLQLQDQNGEIVRFNFTGTRFVKDLKPLYSWDSTSGNATLGSSTEIWLGAHMKNVYQYGAQISPPITLGTTTTPSVANGKVFKVPVVGADRAITAFQDAVNGQEIILLGVSSPHTWTVAAENTFILLSSAWTNALGKTLHLIYDSSIDRWLEISRK